MKEKSLLLFETKEIASQKYFDFLRETVWEIYHKQNLEGFLESIQNEKYDLIIVEESMTPDEILRILAKGETPLIVSNTAGRTNEKGLIAISRTFTSSELINAIGKAAFLKVASKNDTESDIIFTEDDNEEGDDPLILEPVFEKENEDAVMLTPENEPILKDSIKSSWDMPDKTMENNENDFMISFNNKDKEPDKKDIFERIEEIDSILTSLSEDIAQDKHSDKTPKSVLKEKVDVLDEESDMKTEPYNISTDPENLVFKDNDDADFLFDDNYKYEEKNEKKKKFEPIVQTEIQKELIDDFEAILKDKPLSPSKNDFFNESQNQTEFKIENHREEFVKESYETEEVIEKTEEKTEEKHSETIDEKNEIVNVLETSFQNEEHKNIDSELIKNEVRIWLEKNSRTIIKEIVLEQLSKLSGKDE